MSKTLTDQYWLRLQGLPMVTTGAEEEKEAGIAKVSETNEVWMDFAIVSAEAYLYHHAPNEFTAEDMRLHVEPRAGLPMHPNAWGALVNTLARRKQIARTGRWVKSTIKSSHARMIPVYRRNNDQTTTKQNS